MDDKAKTEPAAKEDPVRAETPPLKVPPEAENIEHATRRVMRVKAQERWEKFGI
ncbi:hypothetical protein R5H30_08100 [Sulfitobacter sp. D35]|uniref:hypothetical protein n=1 Tax=Sulfitobacter sp. D35 TaxID=3083252 RepID=UPI00296FE993|nr:hypothetical protein [Sulfitobacter sp. D35]MDW4497937.1 hypothetical protein [Sulfitobacter sp. D35]